MYSTAFYLELLEDFPPISSAPEISLFFLTSSVNEAMSCIQKLGITCTIHTHTKNEAWVVITFPVSYRIHHLALYTAVNLLFITFADEMQLYPSDDPLPEMNGNKHSIIGRTLGDGENDKKWLDYYINQVVDADVLRFGFIQTRYLQERAAA